MRESVRFEWLTVILIIACCVGCSKAPSVKPPEELEKTEKAEESEKAQELEKGLAAIRSQNVGKGTDWAKLEAESLELAKDFDSPADLGRIYATIARIYSDAGFTSKDAQIPKTIEYAKKALGYPLDVPTQCYMYGKWGGALIAKSSGYPKEEMAKVRREAVVPILRGLKLALDNKAPKEIQEPPLFKIFHLYGQKNSPYNQKQLKKQEEQVAIQEKVKLLNELYIQRLALTQRCVTLYSRKPYETDELFDMASEILAKHKDFVEELVSEVETEIVRKRKE